MYPDDVDDVDILFARLQPAVLPADLSARVLTGAQRRSHRRHLIGYTLLAVSILLAAILSFSIGQQLRVSGALALFDLLFDVELLSEAPTEIVLGLVEFVPWHLAALVLASLGMVVVAVRLALSPSIRLANRTLGR